MPPFLKDAKRWLPGAIISIVLIAAILYFVDIPRVIAAIRAADYRILALATVIAFLWLYMRAIVWRTLLRDRASYRDTLMALGEGYLLNNILPFRLGEIGRAFMLSRKSGLQFAEILPTIIIERAVDVGFTAAIFLAALPFIAGTEDANRIGIIIGVLVVIGLVGMYLLARNDAWALSTFHKFSARWPAIQSLGGGLLESFLAGLAVLTDGWVFARFLFWMTLNWLVAIVNYYSGHPRLLPPDPVDVGDVRPRRSCIRRGRALSARRSRHLRRCLRRSPHLAHRRPVHFSRGRLALALPQLSDERSPRRLRPYARRTIFIGDLQAARELQGQR